MPHAVQHHGVSVPVDGLDNFVVVHRAARLLFSQPTGNLALDLLRAGGIGLERQCLIPGFARIALTSRPPVRIAEMIPGFAAVRFEHGCALHEVDRLQIVAKAVVRPAETVEQIAVVRLELDGLLDQRQALFQLQISIDPAKAEIIENQGLIGIELRIASL